MSDQELDRVGERVEELLAAVGDADPNAAEAASELVRELLGLYGAGLARILACLEQIDPAAVERLAEDRLVAGLLSLHDLHPVAVQTRVRRALERVRNALALQGGDIELVGVEGATARLRLTGSTGDGCGATLQAVQQAAEQAVLAEAPEITAVEVAPAAAVPHGGLIPPSALTLGRHESGQPTP